MSYDVLGVLRTTGLIVLIVCDAVMLSILLLSGNIVWFIIFLVITLWILLGEAYGMIIGFKNKENKTEKMTISTYYRKYIERVGWIGYAPLILFWLAMTGLVVHLAFWGGMFQS